MTKLIRTKYQELLVYAVSLFGVLLVEVYSLFRNYPPNPACGKLVTFDPLKILVNCDSAVFLKDSDNPYRLFNGESNYVDRPLFSIFNNIIYRFLKNIPDLDVRRTVVGISGTEYSYSLIQYGIYVLFNLVLLVIAYRLILGIFDFNPAKLRDFFSLRALVTINALLFVAANELAKTFFWTPHSQMFNLLIPVIAVSMIKNIEKELTTNTFIAKILLILTSMFLYPAIGLLLPLLFFTRYSHLFIRIGIISTCAIGYISYPFILRFLGYQYNNEQISKFREFIWLIDGLNGRSPSTIYFERLRNLFESMPVIPSLLILFFLLIVLKTDKNFLTVKQNVIFIFFTSVYFFYVYGLGLGARRVTFAPVLFVGLYLFLYINQNRTRYSNPLIRPLLTLLATFQIGSWMLTTGPLV